MYVNSFSISHPAAALAVVAVLAICGIRCAAQLEACVEHRVRRPTDKLLSTSPRELLQCDVEEFNKCVLTCVCFCFVAAVGKGFVGPACCIVP